MGVMIHVEINKMIYINWLAQYPAHIKIIIIVVIFIIPTFIPKLLISVYS